jgi:uncharacterized protein (TIGR02246 family)
MSTRGKGLTLACVLFGGLTAFLGTTALTLAPYVPPGGTAAAAQQKPEPPPSGKDSREADRAEIQAQTERFLKAFRSGDAERVASFWTADGELSGDDGVYRGRAALAKAYRDLFGAKEERQAEIQRESLRFPSHDTAIDEGHFKVRTGKGEPTASRYSILHVREGGKWLMAVVREWPAEHASLVDLEWLIGTWVARGEDAEVRTTYQWMWDQSFIEVQFTIRQKDRTVSGFQMIGVDPGSRELRTWTFESEGGVGEAAWSRDGKNWVLESEGRLADGSTLRATNILTPLDPDSFTWQSVERSVDGEAVDDLPLVKVTRVKEKR